jgi:hypothetical protein
LLVAQAKAVDEFDLLQVVAALNVPLAQFPRASVRFAHSRTSGDDDVTMNARAVAKIIAFLLPRCSLAKSPLTRRPLLHLPKSYRRLC